MTDVDEKVYCEGCKHLSHKALPDLKCKHPKRITYLYDPLKRKAGYCVVYHPIEKEINYCQYYEKKKTIHKLLEVFKRYETNKEIQRSV